MKRNSEKGVLMVEAAIYMPLVIAIVIFLLYLAFFNMQEFLMMYEAQRVAAVAARETAYPGYSVFGMGNEKNQIDFFWPEGQELPNPQDITAYYTSQHRGITDLYREVECVANYLGISSGKDAEQYESRFSEALRESTLISLGTIGSPDVNIDYGLLGDGITVEFTHEIPQPGVFTYLGIDIGTTLKSTAYSYSVNPAEFARTVNLAADFADFVMKKLGMEGQWTSILEKIKSIVEFVF